MVRSLSSTLRLAALFTFPFTDPTVNLLDQPFRNLSSALLNSPPFSTVRSASSALRLAALSHLPLTDPTGQPFRPTFSQPLFSALPSSPHFTTVRSLSSTLHLAALSPLLLTDPTGQPLWPTFLQPLFSALLSSPHFSTVQSASSTLRLPAFFTFLFTDPTGKPFRTTFLQPPPLSTISTNLGPLFLNVSMTSVIWFGVLFCIFHYPHYNHTHPHSIIINNNQPQPPGKLEHFFKMFIGDRRIL